LTVRIPAELRRDLDRVLKEEKIAVSDLLRSSLERYLAMRDIESIRKRAMKQAAKQGIYTDEDVFRILS